MSNSEWLLMRIRESEDEQALRAEVLRAEVLAAREEAAESAYQDLVRRLRGPRLVTR